MKLYHTLEGNVLKNLTDGNKGKSSKTKKYKSKKLQNKPRPEPKSETEFKVQCTDLEGYIFDLGSRASDEFPQKTK